jgi:endonuclease/exonuclease/phosphatase family metal-dependent hydrolase
LIRRTGLARLAVFALSIAVLCGLLAAAAGATIPPPEKQPKPHPSKQAGKGAPVTVMTRNLYLGADLGPAIASTSTESFIEANGGILRQVDATNFPVRAKGLAKEILGVEPDLVGMQEVALWRTAPPSLGPVFSGRPEATTVKYDFLQLLLAQLNKHGRHYRLVIAQDEFDFEAPADVNGVPGDGPGGFGVLANAELNGRLTMRDVILARAGAGVRTSQPRSGNFEHLLTVKVAGAREVTITRGWTSVVADVSGSRFRLVNAHLESFDDPKVVPSIRAQQAGELATGAAVGVPATKLPVIMLGDFNSDLKTVGNPGDGQAYRVLTQAGFRERSTYKPLNCCIEESNFDLTGGNVSEFDHKVDHIMTNAPKSVKLVSSGVTGRQKSHGYWDSDHAGLYTVLRFLR